MGSWLATGPMGDIVRSSSRHAAMQRLAWRPGYTARYIFRGFRGFHGGVRSGPFPESCLSSADYRPQSGPGPIRSKIFGLLDTSLSDRRPRCRTHRDTKCRNGTSSKWLPTSWVGAVRECRSSPRRQRDLPRKISDCYGARLAICDASSKSQGSTCSRRGDNEIVAGCECG